VDIAPDNDGLMTYANVKSAGECCDYCAQFPGCVSWTLFENSCFLKPGYENQTASKGCTSGYLGKGPPPVPTPLPVELPKKWSHAGITYTGGRYCPDVKMGSDKALMSLKHLASTGATWVAIIVTQYQWTIDDVSIFPLYNASEVKDVTSDYYTFVTLSEDEVSIARSISRSTARSISRSIFCCCVHIRSGILLA
jgi:hypothetical protein